MVLDPSRKGHHLTNDPKYRGPAPRYLFVYGTRELCCGNSAINNGCAQRVCVKRGCRTASIFLKRPLHYKPLLSDGGHSIVVNGRHIAQEELARGSTVFMDLCGWYSDVWGGKEGRGVAKPKKKQQC